MLRVGVCDEKRIHGESIGKLIDSQKMKCEISFFTNLEELERECAVPDLLFYSVCNKTKTETEFKKLHELLAMHSVILIFIAETTEYALEAFDMQAFHYILSPIDKDIFSSVFEKAVKKAREKNRNRPLVIKMGTTHYSLPVEEIFYAENNGRKIILHTKNSNIEFYEKMDTLEKQLGSMFFRSHRGYLVSLAQISGYDSCNIYLKNGDSVYLAKRKYGEFTKCYMEYLKC